MKEPCSCAWLTEVDVVISSTLAVHLVDKEAGHGLEEQVEDGHTETEAKHISWSADGQVVARVKDPEVDDVSQHRHNHPQEKLRRTDDRGNRTHVCLLRLLRIIAGYCVSRSEEQKPTLVIMPRGKRFTPHSPRGKRSQSHAEKKSTISAVGLKNARNAIHNLISSHHVNFVQISVWFINGFFPPRKLLPAKSSLKYLSSSPRAQLKVSAPLSSTVLPKSESVFNSTVSL